MKLKLSSGIKYGYGLGGVKVCIGAMMGRSNLLPENKNSSIKLRLERLKWVDGDYDQGGAYWGNSGHGDVYCAWFNPSADNRTIYSNTVEIFVRAKSRDAAKIKVRDILPNVIFHR